MLNIVSSLLIPHCHCRHHHHHHHHQAASLTRQNIVPVRLWRHHKKGKSFKTKLWWHNLWSKTKLFFSRLRGFFIGVEWPEGFSDARGKLFLVSAVGGRMHLMHHHPHHHHCSPWAFLKVKIPLLVQMIQPLPVRTSKETLLLEFPSLNYCAREKDSLQSNYIICV